MNKQDSWSRLLTAGLVSGAVPESTANEDPWPLCVLQGAGGWLGAMFILGAIAVPLLSFRHNEGGIIFGLGVVMTAVVIPLLRRQGGIVLTQFGLAMSLAAQGAVAGGLGVLCGDWGSIPAIGCAMCSSILLLSTPQFVHRWWCAAIGCFAILSLLDDYLYVLTGPLAVAIVALLLTTPRTVRYRAVTRPVGLGLACAWSLWFAVCLANRHRYEWSLSSGALEVMAVTIAVIAVLRQARVSWPRIGPVLIVALVPASLGLVIPGVSIALTLLLVAVAERERALLVVSVSGLLLLIGVHYQLDHAMPLITKAAGLTGVGLAALVLRIVSPYGWRKCHA